MAVLPSVAECLERIRRQDSEIQAWTEVAPQPPLGTGSLAGVPVGVKDIVETAGLRTEFGSPLYRGRMSAEDAQLVRMLRERGAIVLGKTHTTAFAYYDAAPTRNPRDLTRTPGGSSSGSAAAVAAGMAPLTIGSQTQGSILRPASFCGVIGFKPTYGLLPTEGVLPFAPSLDTVGFFAADISTLSETELFGHAAHAPNTLCVPAFDPVDDEMQRGFDDAVEILRQNGWRVRAAALPEGFSRVLAAVRTVNDYEGARTHRERWERHGDAIGPKLAQLVHRGLGIADAAHQDALRHLTEMREQMRNMYAEHPVLATPAAPGVAPSGLSFTGDPRCNSPWTALHGPAISAPMPVRGLPLGMQLTAAPGQDALLLETAANIFELFQASSTRATIERF